ncbi:hypothetical protein WDD9_003933 [Paenibacillus melissococcoides]|nr:MULTISPECIES: hypothetical protein [Paenibacillus]EJW16438.1 hypothetical protein PAV_5c00170 [Paenibacillus alvei DSM 29]MEB9893864.1 hypothetical protein [Bacillus cereus]CAH8705154.1 hypothetical protein HTL2_000813 [Paenibacillus melissococcoides]CAH8709919.1 hypothetical protein WDD9_002415 [Paenibacillus melissococcoides]CAH8710646.1 hypothetical protein HTL2_002702 [Paenibacillus melissococcoides]
MKVKKECLLRMAERAGTSIVFHPQNPAWVKEPGDVSWKRWRQLYKKMDSRMRYAQKKERKRRANESTGINRKQDTAGISH